MFRKDEIKDFRNNRPVDKAIKMQFQNDKNLSFIVGHIFTFVAGVFLLVYIFDWIALDTDIPAVDYEYVYKHGEQTKGTIIDLHHKKSVVSGEKPTVISYVFYKKNIPITAKTESLKTYQNSYLKVGKEMNVRYLGDESILVNFPTFHFKPFLRILIPTIFLLIGIYFTMDLNKYVNTNMYLLKHGEIIKGYVIKITRNPSPQEYGIYQSFMVHYRYYDSHGKQHHGLTKSHDYRFPFFHEEGEEVFILKSRLDESVSRVYPRMIARDNKWPLVYYKDSIRNF